LVFRKLFLILAGFACRSARRNRNAASRRMAVAVGLQAAGHGRHDCRRGIFRPEGWLKTAVPSTVLAAQAAAGVFPDPYYGMNLRQIPGTSYPIGAELFQPADAAGQPVSLRLVVSDEFTRRPLRIRTSAYWLHFGGINYRGEIWLNGHKIADSPGLPEPIAPMTST
jgi:hypothetical protein